MKIYSSLLIALLVAASALISAAQTPEQIDVKFMEFSKVGSSGATSFKMTAADSAQNTLNYQSADSAALGIIQFSTACPCYVPGVYNTNIFPAQIIAGLGETAGRIRFYITSSVSSPIFLNQRVLSKKKDFLMNGTTELRGRIEVRNNADNIVAVDNDVVLTGSYSVLYWKPYLMPSGRKATDFKSLVYSLTAPAN